MAHDLELIEQLEKETGKKLNKYSLEDKEKTYNSFTVDPEGHVVEKFQNLKELILLGN